MHLKKYDYKTKARKVDIWKTSSVIQFRSVLGTFIAVWTNSWLEATGSEALLHLSDLDSSFLKSEILDLGTTDHPCEEDGGLQNYNNI